VAAVATAIAEQLGLPRAEVDMIRLAASLHDLGKLAIPEELLQKPAELTTAEWLVVRRHPEIGHRMLESLGVAPLADWVLHHHERWDGSGYPDGLAGDDIPLGSRIILVADAFDAMMFGRLYRRPLPREEALTEIERCAGTQFDPQVVRAFFAAVGVGDPVVV
jgi:HD-GYP domain-containing protein (c-di-GMP phosphodiesterase class II)